MALGISMEKGKYTGGGTEPLYYFYCRKEVFNKEHYQAIAMRVIYYRRAACARPQYHVPSSHIIPLN